VIPALVTIAVALLTTAADAATVQLLATHPAQPATLANGHTLNLRIRVESPTAQDIHIVEVRSHGAKVGWYATSGIESVPAGGGETVLFTFLQPKEGDVHVDEIMVKTTEAGAGATTPDPAGETHVLPLDATWTVATGVDSAENPAWVTEHRAQTNARRAAARAAEPPPSLWSHLLFFAGSLLFVALVIAAYWLPIRWMRRWQGGWRLAAAACMVPITLSIVNITLGLMSDPASHNLFPFEIAIAGAIAFGLMIVVRIAHAIAAGRNNAS
jgi:hypothetical protein